MQLESKRSEGAVVPRPDGGADGEPAFFDAGREASGEFRCAECGYGVIVRSILPACPMCRGLLWEEPAASPFAR